MYFLDFFYDFMCFLYKKMYFCVGFSLSHAELSPQNVFCNVKTRDGLRRAKKGKPPMAKPDEAGRGRERVPTLCKRRLF